MPRPLAEQVIVLTGASSGIGRETATLLGAAGASLVLAARSEAALRDVAGEVQRAGGSAHVVPCDVSRWEDVRRLGEEAIARYGRIDTWVNNAAVAEYATAWETEPEEMERILGVNLLGTMYGCRVAFEHMALDGEGVIINVGSVNSRRSLPLLSVYSASKAGVKGYTEALRMELEREWPAIHAVLIMPSGINTPLFEHARSKLGILPRPVPPVYEPRTVAEAIAFCCEHPLKEVVVGGAGKAAELLERLSPALADRVFGAAGAAWKMQQSGEPDDARDNLFEPSGGAPARGRWSDEALDHSAYTSALELHPGRKFALGLGLIGAALLVGSRLRPAGGR